MENDTVKRFSQIANNVKIKENISRRKGGNRHQPISILLNRDLHKCTYMPLACTFPWEC